MKILYILPYLPIPPNSGNKNLIYGLLKYINQHAEFDVAMLMDSGMVTTSQAEELMRREFPRVGQVKVFKKPTGWRRLLQRIRYVLRGRHPALGNYDDPAMRSWLRQATKIAAYDVVHFDMFHTAIYLGSVNRVARVLIASDAYSMAAATARRQSTGLKESLNLRAQEWAFSKFEKKIYPLFDAVCTVSPVDGEYLSRAQGLLRVHTVGIAVAQQYAERPISHFDTMEVRGNEARLLLTGTLAHSVVAQGVAIFLNRTLPGLRRIYPSLGVTVLGKDASPELTRLFRPPPRG